MSWPILVGRICGLLDLVRHFKSQVSLHGANDVIGDDHVEALRQFSSSRECYRPQAQALIFLVAITQWLDSALPTTTVVAARERAVRVQILMVGVSLPLH